MKKPIAIAVLLVAVSALVFAQMKNGTYKAQEPKADERGYVASIKIVVKGGVISKIDYDEAKAGNSKWKDKNYNATMKKIGGIAWTDAVQALEAALVKSNDVAAVDAVSGATELSTRFKKLAAEALASAK